MSVADVRTPTVDRAAASLGISGAWIYRLVAKTIDEIGATGGTVLDVGCGVGNLRPFLSPKLFQYIGTDINRYAGFPSDAEFIETDLETGRILLADGVADLVTAVEVIEHVENPRALVRELARLVRPGGWVVMTTPNQLSLLSILTLVVRGQFAAFQDVHYPAHLTALLETDLRRIAAEANLTDVTIRYSLHDRVPGTAFHYPKALAAHAPRRLSDTVLLAARRARQMERTDP